VSREYYATQSPVTDPGATAGHLSGLPPDLAGLQRVVRDLVIHYRAEDPLSHGIPGARMAEIDTRYADSMIGRIVELQAPLESAREPRERLVGCCRDFTVLFVAMARAQGVPARARIGFATYFVAGWNVDHEVAEVWDEAKGQWRLVDAELRDGHVDPNDGAVLGPLDLSRERFLLGGTAWQRCRAGEADPETFVVAPDLQIPDTRSWPYLAHNVVHDLAALNKVEMILWDSWGLTEQGSLADKDLELLDRVAAVTASTDPDLAELRRLYDSPSLRVPATVTSYTPDGGGPVDVAVRGLA
jgi:Transglutaminase-like superfamily